MVLDLAVVELATAKTSTSVRKGHFHFVDKVNFVSFFENFSALYKKKSPKDGTHECHADAHCTNSVGSYECACKDGHEGAGRQCSDLNECQLG